jgi:hypothetical protein
MKHRFFLAGVGINSVAVVHDKSNAIKSNTQFQIYKSIPATDFTPDWPDKIGVGVSMYPNTKSKIMVWDLLLPQTPSNS